MSIERGARGGLPILGRLSAAPAAVVLALFTGITGHALSVSTTSLTAGTNPTVWGQSVTFTATISPGAAAPTRTVTFRDGGISLATCVGRPVAARIATCTTSTLAVTSHTITAVYSGDGTYAGSTSAAVVQVVKKGTTTSVVTSPANPSVSGQTATYTTTVTATPPSSGTRTGTVNFQDAGVTIVGCSAKAVAVAGTAICAVAYAGPGSHRITAAYSGDANFAASTSAVLTQTVRPGATGTAVASSLNPSSTGASVTFTARVTVTAPASGVRTGSVNFEDAGTTIAGCGAKGVAVAGTATCATSALGAGLHAITAVYSGDTNLAPSTSAAFAQTVINATSTTVTSSVNPSVFGQSVQYRASIAGGPVAGGSVTFRDGGVNVSGCVAVPMTAGAASCTGSPTVGAHAITAVYSGDASHAASTSARLTQTVNADSTSTTITSTAAPSMFGQSVTLTATVTANGPGAGTPAGTVAFKDGGASIGGCTNVAMAAGVATCTTTMLAVAAHPTTAVYSGSGTFTKSTSAVFTQTVTRGATATVVTSATNPSLTGQVMVLTATMGATAPAAGAPSGTVNFLDAGGTVAGCGARAIAMGAATCTASFATVGPHAITAVYSGDTRFLTSTSAALTQVVNKGATSSVVTSSVNPSVSGQGLTFTAAVTSSAPASGTPTGTAAFDDAGLTIAGCGAQPLVAGIASCSLVYVGAGPRTITATYSGDANFLISTSTAITQVVNRGVAAATVLSSVSPSLSGHGVLYTVTVTAAAPASGTPTGTVTFDDGGSPIASCGGQVLTRGVTVCSLTYPPGGAHDITAHYGGDSNFDPSVSPVMTVFVAAGGVDAVSVTPATPQVGAGLSSGGIALLLAGITTVLIGRRRWA